MNPLVLLFGAGVLVVVGMAFWAAVQNWLADFLERSRTTFGALTYTLQTALVLLDRVVVNGQRVIVATARLVFRENNTQEEMMREEVKRVARTSLPVDVLDKLEKLESGQVLQYELKMSEPTVSERASERSGERSNHVPTYRVAVRFGDEQRESGEQRDNKPDEQRDQQSQ
jgi:hypothetical protein